MQKVFATGVEARLVLRHEEPDNEASVTIASHHVIVVSFAGVLDGMLRYWQAAVFATETADDVEAEYAVRRALRHFPMDGGDLSISEVGAGEPVRRVVSRVDSRFERKLEPFGIVRPARDVEVGQLLENHRVVGLGLGFEFKGGKSFVVPYISVQTVEERDGHDVVVVVHARALEPFCPGFQVGGPSWEGLATLMRYQAENVEKFCLGDTADIEVMRGYFLTRGRRDGAGRTAVVRSRTMMEVALADAKARAAAKEHAAKSASVTLALGEEPNFVGPTRVDPIVAIVATSPEPAAEEEAVQTAEVVTAPVEESVKAPAETEDEILARMIAEEEAEVAAKTAAAEEATRVAVVEAERRAKSAATRAAKKEVEAARKAAARTKEAEASAEASAAEA